MMAVVLDPAFAFAELDARLTELRFVRDESVKAVTQDAISGEPELAAWSRGRERLTYTFNPVVSLRVIDGHAVADETDALLSSRLPALDIPAVGQMLASA